MHPKFSVETEEVISGLGFWSPVSVVSSIWVGGVLLLVLFKFC